MNITKNPCKTISIEFTRQEGHWLVSFLEERTKNSDSQDSKKTIEEVLAKLCDADTIALWLRENVIVNLTHDEAAQTLKALEAAMEDSASESPSPLMDIARNLKYAV